MPPTLHKYFIHAPGIISNALLPIGYLSEEAQEAHNEDFKKYREFNSRKCKREESNRNIFNLFLLSSDPLISSMRKLPAKKIQTLPEEALHLIIPTSPDLEYAEAKPGNSSSSVDDNFDEL